MLSIRLTKNLIMVESLEVALCTTTTQHNKVHVENALNSI